MFFSFQKKMLNILFIIGILFPFFCWGDNIRFRIVAINPSSVKTQFVPVKVYLPEEVKPKNIIDLGGLKLDFDSQKSLYYVYDNGVILKPRQTKIFEVEIEDIWLIPSEEIEGVKRRIDKLLVSFKGSSHYDEVKKLSERANSLIAEIIKSQSDDTISRSQHIGVYRANIKSLSRLKDEISDMEKLLETKTGPLTPDILAESKFKTLSPTKTATWIVIFSIIIFIGLLSLVFFFTWYRSSRATHDIISEAKKISFGEEESSESTDIKE